MGTLQYELSGSGERVALLHGVNQSARAWRRVTDLLAETHEVMALDLPFHGRSADVEVRDLGELAALLAKTVGRATYVGYFVGGRAAIDLALRDPDLVERLVLIGTVAGAKDADRPRRKAEDEKMAEALEDPSAEKAQRFFEENIERRLARSDFHLDDAGEEIERASNFENSPRSLAKMVRALGMGAPSYHERLCELEMPVLLVYGELAVSFGEVAQEVAGLIGPNATVTKMRGAGHPAPFEQPADFVELLRSWMRANPASGPS